ncbi:MULTISPECIES: hypothetical protein [Alphaproteobacteria]|uniref:hypothetical protein n=1 Tax=Alphaproteobacteria TaxID=28211 RepID=UPI0026074AC5|nr:hypothetical protein [Nitratireductor sp.]MCV0349030.1 hypothetical protein [Nitratireductor sp.]
MSNETAIFATQPKTFRPSPPALKSAINNQNGTSSSWTGMAIAALLAGGGAVYFTKQKLDNANFQDAINLIQNDDDAYWCGAAQA